MSSFSSPPPPRVVLLWNISAAQRNWPLAHEENFYARVRDKGMLQYNSDVKKKLVRCCCAAHKSLFRLPTILKDLVLVLHFIIEFFFAFFHLVGSSFCSRVCAGCSSFRFALAYLASFYCAAVAVAFFFWVLKIFCIQ